MPPASRGSIALVRGRNYRPVFLLVQRCRLTSLAARVASPPMPITPPQIRLREYQEECIKSVLAHLEKGHKRLGISLATGSGKTVIFTQLIDRMNPLSETATQTLILAHRQELVDQAARHCTNAYPAKTIEVEMGCLRASGAADITVASVQSIISGDRISKFDPSRFKLVLVDEAHHIVAPGYMKTLKHFGLDKQQNCSPALVGVSATLSRFDGLGLGAALDHIVYHKDYIDMIGEKWLSDVMFTTVETKADVSKVRKGAGGDFQSGELSKIVNTKHINEITVRAWLGKAKGRKSTMVFCVDLAHVASLTKAFREHGIEAQFVTGDTPKIERVARLDSFRAGEYPILVNCGVFTEGTDVPNIDCVLLARPTKSRNLLVQMIGRGMRLHPGKVNCHIIDMVASLSTGIVTTPTLFGLDPSELVEEATVDDMKLIQDAKGKELESEERVDRETLGVARIDSRLPTRVNFTDYDSVFDLIEDMSGDQHIRAVSRNAWVEIGSDRYVLTLATSGAYLKIEPTSGVDGSPMYSTFELVPLRVSGTKAPYRAPREIGTATNLIDAIHGADTFASQNYSQWFISKFQSWRRGPATESQVAFLNKLRSRDDFLTPESITKGQAGDMITKLKHGARGRFAKMEADRRRKDKIQLKMEQDQALKDRENVRIGPVLD